MGVSLPGRKVSSSPSPVDALLDHGLHLGDARRATHQHHVVHALLVNAGVLQALLHGTSEDMGIYFIRETTRPNG